jgi:hypothetical protein
MTTKTLCVTSTTTLKDDLNVEGGIAVARDFIVLGNTILDGGVCVNELLSAKDGLNVTGDVFISDDLFVTGNVTFLGTLTGNIPFQGNTFASLDIFGDLCVGGITYAKGGLSVTGGNLTASSGIDVTGGGVMDMLCVNGLLTTKGGLDVLGSVTISDTLLALDDALIGNSLCVGSDLQVDTIRSKTPSANISFLANIDIDPSRVLFVDTISGQSQEIRMTDTVLMDCDLVVKKTLTTTDLNVTGEFNFQSGNLMMSSDVLCANTLVVDIIQPKTPGANVCIQGNLDLDILYVHEIAGKSPIEILDLLELRRGSRAFKDIVLEAATMVAELGGGVMIKDAGNVMMTGGGMLCVQDKGSVLLSGETDMMVEDGGNVMMMGGGMLCVQDKGVVVLSGETGMMVEDGGNVMMMGGGTLCVQDQGSVQVVGGEVQVSGGEISGNATVVLKGGADSQLRFFDEQGESLAFVNAINLRPTRISATHRSGSFIIPGDGTPTSIDYDIPYLDAFPGSFEPSTGKFTAPRTGFYQISFFATFAYATNGFYGDYTTSANSTSFFLSSPILGSGFNNSGNANFIGRVPTGSFRLFVTSLISGEIYIGQRVTGSLVTTPFNIVGRAGQNEWIVDSGDLVFTSQMFAADAQSAVFTGSINGTTLTVTDVSLGTITVGQVISGSNIEPETIVQAPAPPLTPIDFIASIYNSTLMVSAETSGTIAIGGIVSGAGVVADTRIVQKIIDSEFTGFIIDNAGQGQLGVIVGTVRPQDEFFPFTPPAGEYTIIGTVSEGLELVGPGIAPGIIVQSNVVSTTSTGFYRVFYYNISDNTPVATISSPIQIQQFSNNSWVTDKNQIVGSQPMSILSGTTWLVSTIGTTVGPGSDGVTLPPFAGVIYADDVEGFGQQVFLTGQYQGQLMIDTDIGPQPVDYTDREKVVTNIHPLSDGVDLGTNPGSIFVTLFSTQIPQNVLIVYGPTMVPPNTGYIIVTTSLGPQRVSFTGSNHNIVGGYSVFTGVSGGAGVMSTGGLITFDVFTGVTSGGIGDMFTGNAIWSAQYTDSTEIQAAVATDTMFSFVEASGPQSIQLQSSLVTSMIAGGSVTPMITNMSTSGTDAVLEPLAVNYTIFEIPKTT